MNINGISFDFNVNNKRPKTNRIICLFSNVRRRPVPFWTHSFPVIYLIRFKWNHWEITTDWGQQITIYQSLFHFGVACRHASYIHSCVCALPKTITRHLRIIPHLSLSVSPQIDANTLILLLYIIYLIDYSDRKQQTNKQQKLRFCAENQTSAIQRNEYKKSNREGQSEFDKMRFVIPWSTDNSHQPQLLAPSQIHDAQRHIHMHMDMDNVAEAHT